MTMASADRRSQKYGPIFDVDPMTGASIEIFYADRTLESFGREGAGWFWWPRRCRFAPEGPAIGPFPTSYSAYRDALRKRTDPRQFEERSPGFRLCADRAGACMRQGAAEQIASEAARAAARAELNSVKNLLEYQMLAPTIGGAGSRLRTILGRKFPDIRESTGKIQADLCLNGRRNGIIALDSEG